jgi:hypothetical protein
MALTSFVDSIVTKGAISDSDVLALRRDYYTDAKISKEEASQLFEINDKCTTFPTAWSQLFVEALSDFIVHQMKPEGYVDKINAEWLMFHINADGKLESLNELELLIAVIEKAKSVPTSLNLFALNQVRRAILEGEGLTRSGKSLEPGVVSAGDVEILRRILYAYGSGNNIGITTEEAELLFDINDATSQADNHPTWNVLFAQAIANHVMMAQGYHAPDRETALRHEEWLDEKQPSEGFIAAMVKGLREVYKGLGHSHSKNNAPKRGSALESRIQASEKITASEAKWLVSRINRDGKMSAAERAVLTFIKQESPEIDPALKPLLDLVA